MPDLIENFEQPSYRNQTLKWFLVISLILHVVSLMSFGLLTGFRFLDPPTVVQERDNDVVFELAETPVESNTDTAPDNARLVSDKNMKAQNIEQTPNLATDPFNPGISEFPETPTPPSPKEQSFAGNEGSKNEREEEATRTEKATMSEENAYIPAPGRKFSREALLGKESASPNREKPGFDNKEFSVDNLGSFAFNTYNWNFAPYMLYLKRRIEDHIFPPPAFTRLGIVDGRFVLRFKIGRDGSLESIEVMNVDGHQSLLITSENSIKGSSPFKPLPTDFPEDFLEVTGTFVFTVVR